jgi:signal transduction histidine kinase
MGQIGAPRFHLPTGSVALRYGLALVSVAAAFVLAIVWLHFDSPLPFTGFALTAIAITFWYGRTKPGILAVLLATLARSYFFQPATSPVSRLLYDSVFLVFALLMIWLTRRRNDLAVKVAQRTAELADANENLKFEIAERDRAEEDLRASEQEQREIAEQLERERARLVEAQEVAKIGSWELEPQSSNVIWSEQTHRIFETDPSRFHPTRPRFLEFIHPKDRAKVDAAFEASLDKGSPCTVEYRIVMPDGRVKFLEERWQIFHNEQGTPVRVAGTCRDITERVRAEKDFRQLSGRLLRLQDEERRKIARDLHDSTGQNLAVLATMLGELRNSISSTEREAHKLLSDCTELVNRCIREVRTLSYLLHPPVLDQAGLEDAIRDYVDGFTKRSGIDVELELSASVGRMARDVELALFRVVQESLTNIRRHSGSQRAKIRIHRNSDLTLEISDYGRGASASAPKGEEKSRFKLGVGIPSMQERVSLIGGRLDIDSTGNGTTVRVTIPLRGEPP